MKLIQVIDSTTSEPKELLVVNNESLTDEEIEDIVKESAKFVESEDGEAYLNSRGVERVFVEEIYV